MFKRWIMLSIGLITIQRIAQLISLILIRWIVIYPMDSTIHLLNNWSLSYEFSVLWWHEHFNTDAVCFLTCYLCIHCQIFLLCYQAPKIVTWNIFISAFSVIISFIGSLQLLQFLNHTIHCGLRKKHLFYFSVIFWLLVLIVNLMAVEIFIQKLTLQHWLLLPFVSVCFLKVLTFSCMQYFNNFSHNMTSWSSFLRGSIKQCVRDSTFKNSFCTCVSQKVSVTYLQSI